MYKVSGVKLLLEILEKNSKPPRWKGVTATAWKANKQCLSNK